MSTWRLSPDLRWWAAASPTYIERFGLPTEPDDLRDHRRIGIRLGKDQLYRRGFERDGKKVAVETPDPLTVDATPAAIAFGLNGTGTIYTSETIVQGCHNACRERPLIQVNRSTM